MHYVKLDDVIKALVNLKADENTALYLMDESVRVYNGAVDDCIKAIKCCESVVVTTRDGKDYYLI